ncbi:MAG: alpha/beta hydrolase [Patescibacteria group bacterium]
MKKQIVIIHGGDTFGTYEEYLNFLRNFEIDIERYKTSKDDWKKWLRDELGGDYEVITPVMPNKTNAIYEEWKLWMDKIVPALNDGVILIGHSMGGSFLAKYLSENKFPKKIGGVFLVSAMFDYDDDGNSLHSFSLPDNLDLQTEHIYLYHSEDDRVVPFKSLENFKNKLPSAVVRIFTDRGHINQETFPELISDIRNLN